MFLFGIILMIGFVSAESSSGWSDYADDEEIVDCIGDDSGSTDCLGGDEDISDAPEASTTFGEIAGSESSEIAATRYTDDFYLALGVAAVGLLVLIVLIYFLFKKPRNLWKKKR